MDKYRELVATRLRYDEYHIIFERDFKEEIRDTRTRSHEAMSDSGKRAEAVETKKFQLPDITPKEKHLMYRNLCKLLHPDISKTNTVEEFKKVVLAYETDDDVELYNIAAEHGLYDHPIILTDDIIRQIKTEISEKILSLPWRWCTCTEVERSRVRDIVLNQLRN